MPETGPQRLRPVFVKVRFIPDCNLTNRTAIEEDIKQNINRCIGFSAVTNEKCNTKHFIKPAQGIHCNWFK